MGRFNLGSDRNGSKNVNWESIGKEPVKIASIMATRKYDMFRFLDGNRDVKHFKKLVKSLVAIGILYQPVLVNENYEIVEGQGRFLAMQELNLPVLYVVQKGIGIKECRFLNSCSTNWGIKDHVHSYANGSDKREAYIYLEQLQREFPQFGIRIIYSAASSKPIGMGGGISQNLKSGEIEISESDYERGRKVLAYLDRFSPYLKTLTGRVECMQKALIFCYNNETVDNEYLLEKVTKYYQRIQSIVTEKESIEKLEMVYNFGNLGGREEIMLGDAFKRYNKAKKR